MPTCSAPGCQSGHASVENTAVRRHFFKPPNDPIILKAWETAIPRKNFKVTAKTFVCDILFEPADIVSCYEHVIDGQTVQIPRGRWTLKNGAVPRIFPNIPARLSKAKTAKAGRKPPKLRTIVDPVVTASQSDSGMRNEARESEAAEDIEDVENTPADPTFEYATWFGALQDCSTFESWCVKPMTEAIIFYRLEETVGVVQIQRAVVIRNDLTIAVSSRGRLVPACSYREKGADNLQQLSSLKNVAYCSSIILTL